MAQNHYYFRWMSLGFALYIAWVSVKALQSGRMEIGRGTAGGRTLVERKYQPIQYWTSIGLGFLLAAVSLFMGIHGLAG